LATRSHFLTDALKRSQPFGLRIERNQRWLVRSVETAANSATRKRGLLGRESLDEGTGLVIAPCQGVHTFGMRFPIDIVGVSRDGRVVKVRERVPARRLVFALKAFAILELAAGGVGRSELAEGDTLTVVSTEESVERP
jgi:uncharacterized protein